MQEDRPSRRGDRLLFHLPLPGQGDRHRNAPGHREVPGGRGASPSARCIPELLAMKMDHLEKVEPLANSGHHRRGLGHQRRRGRRACSTRSYLAADGIENVIRVLEDMEDEKHRRPGLYRAQRLLRRLRGRGAHVWRTPTWPRPASSGCANTCPCPRTT